MKDRATGETGIKRGLIYFSCGVIGGGLLGFVLGSQFYSRAMVSMREEIAALSSISDRFAEQQQQVVNLEMADNVNKLAQEKLRQRVTELQTDRVKLESELYVYKKLLEDDETELGLNLENLMIRQVEGDDNRFSYDIVIRRKSVTNQSIEATLSVEIEGELHGIPYSMTLKDADPELDEDALSVSFKYFKVIKGEFILPEHFEPETLVLSLYETGRADSLVIREIRWEPIPHG